MYIDVIVPLAIEGTLTYQIEPPFEIEPLVGMRVLVPLGKKKIYTGIIYALNSKQPEHYNAKSVICILDSAPTVTTMQLKLWDWIADYYMCSLGEVCKAALPSALKLESETKVRINEDFEATSVLPTPQQRILDILSDGKEHDIDELARQLELKTIIRHINQLLNIEAIIIDEQVSDKYKPRLTYKVALHNDISTPQQLQHVLDSLQRAPKQLQLMLEYLHLSNFTETGEVIEISRNELLQSANSTPTILKQLTGKHYLQITAHKISRLNSDEIATKNSSTLSIQQQNALNDIHKHWQSKDVVLLHGVTSSGKTELYIKLIEATIAQGKQVLYLVPEIALTTQLTDRLRLIFGNRLGVYHSKYSDAERAEIYRDLLTDNKYQLILGVRSSIFLPFHRLGLVIIDEEHDTSYKQQDPAPRYHARNMGIVLAMQSKAKVLLGTATPSMESYQNAISGKYGLVTLTERYRNIRLPQIELVDLKESYRRKEIEGHFSDTLIKHISDTLTDKRQVILFQNRRGFAPYVCCSRCGFVPKCVNCDVALTVHKRTNIMSCHYCGYSISLTNTCPSCKQLTLKDHGFGTERIEEEVQQLFPEAKVARMDLDTTRSRRSYESIIHDFAEHKIDILVGTQMVTKGLHFDDVALVAVLNADSMMNIPDFRSHERTFQMLEQVSGRAGRKDKQGMVLIQTRQPEEFILQQVKNHDFIGFFNQQIAERQMFRYPPFYRLMQVVIKNRDESKVRYISDQLQKRLSGIFGKRVSMVIVPVIAWVQNQHIRHILLKIENQASYKQAKCLLKEQINIVDQMPDGKSTTIYVDVDPQ